MPQRRKRLASEDGVCYIISASLFAEQPIWVLSVAGEIQCRIQCRLTKSAGTISRAEWAVREGGAVGATLSAMVSDEVAPSPKPGVEPTRAVSCVGSSRRREPAG